MGIWAVSSAVEHPTLNRVVEGSIPSRPAFILLHFVRVQTTVVRKSRIFFKIPICSKQRKVMNQTGCGNENVELANHLPIFTQLLFDLNALEAYGLIKRKRFQRIDKTAQRLFFLRVSRDEKLIYIKSTHGSCF